jgi:predicted alpha-1,2-mannosidase
MWLEFKFFDLSVLVVFAIPFLMMSNQNLLKNFASYFKTEKPSAPVDFVDPLIGSVSITLQPTRNTAQIPLSLLRMQPITSPGVSDHFVASKIWGFGLNVPGHRRAPVSSLMATAGELALEPAALASDFDRDFEVVTPYFYSVLLEDHQIIAEYTLSERAGFFRFRYPETSTANILLQTQKTASVEVTDDHTVCGFEEFRGMKQFFCLRFKLPLKNFGTFHAGEKSPQQKQLAGKNIGFYAQFPVEAGTDVPVKFGISFISSDQARQNLTQEIPGWDFEAVKKQARQKWNAVLGKIQVDGGSEAQKKVFYTALYRCFERMILISEDGKYFSGYDHQVHTDPRPFYVDDWIWDTYRGVHPLRLLIVPDAEMDMLQSYIRMYEQSGWLPSFPQVNGDGGAMIGHHQAALVADAWFKGFRNFDIQTAYAALKKNATEGTLVPWQEGPAGELDHFYHEHGFFPALKPGQPETVPGMDSFEKRQSVSVTLDHSYDDWCLAQLAQALKQPLDFSEFMKRAQNYRNLYHPEIGFMVPKSADGQWILPFDPKFSGGTGGRDYFAEMNSWTYTWHVQHDVAGLIELMGGAAIFEQRLDQLFEESLGATKWVFLGQFPDATGLVGQFAMGNEQSFHIPYLYNFTASPWKTQKRVRQLMATWYRDDVMGICGDEDGGALSAWFVFSALGFYPVCPGRPVYYLGSPLFETATLEMGGGKTVKIRAENVSNQNKYIQSLTINGKPWNQPWFEHAEIKNGGEMVFQMGPRPNKMWGIEKPAEMD